MAKKSDQAGTTAKRKKSAAGKTVKGARSAVKAQAGKPAGKTAKKTVAKAAAKAVKRNVKTAARKPARKTSAGSATKRAGTGSGRLKKNALTKAEIKKFHQLLLAKRRSLVGDMTGMEAEALGNGESNNSDLSLMPDHPANVATDNYEQEFTLGLLESERTLLAEIDDALARIADGTYGICLATGQFIGKPRLQARPWAKYCIEYARKLEKGLVRPVEPELVLESES